MKLLFLFSRIKIILIVLVLAVAGYWFWQNYQNAHYLKISEWSVTLPVSSTISGATYHLNADGNIAFLSTKTLDNSTTCQNYYQSQQGSGYYYPSYQFISRLKPADPTTPTDGSGTISAQTAAQKYPDIYKPLGKYIYQYAKGRGVPCGQQTAFMTTAFYNAFKAMR